MRRRAPPTALAERRQASDTLYAPAGRALAANLGVTICDDEIAGSRMKCMTAAEFRSTDITLYFCCSPPAGAAGNDAELRVREGIWHVFEFYAELSEADQSLAEIARFITAPV